MKSYIATDSLWGCETCKRGGSDCCKPGIWCENGEMYSPAYNKLDIIDGTIRSSGPEEWDTEEVCEAIFQLSKNASELDLSESKTRKFYLLAIKALREVINMN